MSASAELVEGEGMVYVTIPVEDDQTLRGVKDAVEKLREYGEADVDFAAGIVQFKWDPMHVEPGNTDVPRTLLGYGSDLTEEPLAHVLAAVEEWGTVRRELEALGFGFPEMP